MASVIDDEDWFSVLSEVSAAIDLHRTALEGRTLVRRRQIRTADDLLRLALAYGPGGQSLRDTATWARMLGIADLSAVALMYRLRDSADWLGQIAGALLARRQTGGAISRVGQMGRRIRLVDGSILSAPGAGQDWRLHAVYDLATERFDSLELTDRTTAETLSRVAVSPGELVIADRVFARPEGLAHILDGGADFLVRMGRRSLRLQYQSGEAFDLDAALEESAAKAVFDRPVSILHGRRKNWPTCPARLIILPKPYEAAQRSRKLALRESQRSQSTIDPLSLKAAGFLMLITSLEAPHITPEALADLYRLRWRIELAFKRLKSLLHMDRLPAREPGLARAWLFSHLIAALLIEDFSPHLRDSPPCDDL